MICLHNHTNSLPLSQARQLSLDQMKQLQPGDLVFCGAYCGCLLRVKVNGRPKTWKRQPERVRIPWKYGLYDYGYFTQEDKLFVRMEV